MSLLRNLCSHVNNLSHATNKYVCKWHSLTHSFAIVISTRAHNLTTNYITTIRIDVFFPRISRRCSALNQHRVRAIGRRVPAGPETTLSGPRGSTWPSVCVVDGVPGSATTDSFGSWTAAAAGFRPLATTCVVARRYGARLPDLEMTLIIFAAVWVWI